MQKSCYYGDSEKSPVIFAAYKTILFSSKVSVKRLFFSTRQQLKKAAIMDLAFIKQTLKNYYLKTNVFRLLQPSSGFYNFSNINV